MRPYFYILISVFIYFQSCGQSSKDKSPANLDSLKKTSNNIIELIDTSGKIIETRFLPPKGYKRINLQKNSFGFFLRNLPLKPHNSDVLYHTGYSKSNFDVYDAVIDLKIGEENLHQCADAIIRLRAEYLWNQKRFDSIHFNFTNGFRVDYSKWIKGYRIKINENQTSWTLTDKPSNSYNDFWSYMETIFKYAGTLSLSKELKNTTVENINIGDVFIKGGSPGHAVIVVDIAVNESTNKKAFLLAQSYMPAQESQILKNPNDKIKSPWYSEDFGEELVTPEWTFNRNQLKKFE